MEYFEVGTKKDILYWSKRLYQKGMSPATSGNISVRTDKGILISSSGVCLNDMDEDDIVLIDFDGNLLEGNKKPSSEKFLHAQIYDLRDDINAIIHSHCPYITAFACSDKTIEVPILPEFIFYFDKIPKAPYGLPSSMQLAIDTAECFKKSDVVLMQNHGVVCGANTLQQCFYSLESIRAYAETYFGTQVLGGYKKLTKKQINEIRKLKLQ